jgi:uncharacterized protein (DUF4415 family)
MIDRVGVSNVFHEWTRDSYRTPDGTRAAAEGADASYSAQTQPGSLNNRTQIFQDTVSVSNTAETVKKYGRSSELKRLKAKKMIELRRDIEAAIIGSGAAVTASGSTAGKLRGLYGFISTNASVGATTGVAPDPTTNTAPVAGTARTFTSALLDAAVLAAYTNGGSASTLLVSPAHKQTASTFTTNVTRQQEVPSTKGGGQVLNTAYTFYGHDFGVTKVLPNRVMAVAGAGLASAAYLVDADKIALGQLRPFESEQMATVGDAKNWQIRTEVTLIVRDEKPLASILDLS